MTVLLIRSRVFMVAQFKPVQFNFSKKGTAVNGFLSSDYFCFEVRYCWKVFSKEDQTAVFKATQQAYQGNNILPASFSVMCSTKTINIRVQRKRVENPPPPPHPPPPQTSGNFRVVPGLVHLHEKCLHILLTGYSKFRLKRNTTGHWKVFIITEVSCKYRH